MPPARSTRRSLQWPPGMGFAEGRIRRNIEAQLGPLIDKVARLEAENTALKHRWAVGLEKMTRAERKEGVRDFEAGMGDEEDRERKAELEEGWRRLAVAESMKVVSKKQGGVFMGRIAQLEGRVEELEGMLRVAVEGGSEGEDAENEAVVVGLSDGEALEAQWERDREMWEDESEEKWSVLSERVVRG